jgi:CheY-like chemotaxis protein
VAEQIEEGARAPEAVMSDTAHSTFAQHRVLVVDDDMLVRMGTVAMLEDLGHVTVEAASASQAMLVLERGDGCDLIVTDHAMPGMTGADLARRIFTSYPGIPVILASGYADLQRIPHIMA